jgi:hypothetical protein
MALEKYPPLTEEDVTNLDKYTQAETDALLNTKAASVHNHTESNITDLDKYTKAEITNLLAGKLDKYTSYDNGSSLDIDGANGTYFTASIAASEELTLSNIVQGVEYCVKVYNSVADDTEGNGIYVTINSGTNHLINYHSKNVFITPLDYIELKLIYDGANYNYTLIRGKELTKNCTIRFAYGTTAAVMNAVISSISKQSSDYTLIIQFSDCPYKYFNGSTDKIIGNGALATVTHALHGFTDGDEVSINVLREQLFSGTTTIVGNGSTATVTRSAHGFLNGDYVTIIGTTNFDGTYLVSNRTTNTFDIIHAYSGTETPPATASINSLDFDGDYTITVVDENTYTFAHTSTGEIIPLTTGITRKIWNITDNLYFSNITNSIIIQGNTSEISSTILHSNQRVYLKSSNSYGIKLNNCLNAEINNIKVYAPNVAIYIGYSSARCLYCFGQTTGAATSRSSLFIQYSFVYVYRYLGSASDGTNGSVLQAYKSTFCNITDIQTYNRTAAYGIKSNGGLATTNQLPYGSTSSSYAILGGQIWQS